MRNGPGIFVSITMLFCLVIFLIIGLTIYLNGCDSAIGGNCDKYFQTQVQIEGHYTQRRTCKECIEYKAK
jgi:hypothetical protein